MSLKVASEDFWSCKLDSSQAMLDWSCPKEDGFEHKLFICQATLGPEAKQDERNIVEVTSSDPESGVSTNGCILSLKVGLNETCSLNLGLTSTSTFKLVSGSGPVHIVGSHLSGVYDIGDLDSDMESMDEETIDEDISTQEAEKENIPSLQKQKNGNKLQSEDSDKESDENEPDEDSDEEDEDEEDEDDDDSDGDAESDEPVEEVSQKVTPKHKGVLKAKSAQNEKTKEKKVSFAKEKKTSVQPPKNFFELKKALEKMQNLPKSQPKFVNFMKSNLKVTDTKLINDAWNWASKNKK